MRSSDGGFLTPRSPGEEELRSFIFVIGFALTFATNALASAVSSPDALFAQEDKLNDRCRGGSGDDPNTQKACDARDKIDAQLKQMGWCWGHAGQIEADKKWEHCSRSKEADSSKVQFDPDAYRKSQMTDIIMSTGDTCMRSQARNSLFHGMRDREVIVDAMIGTCGKFMADNLVDKIGESRSVAEKGIRVMAYRILEETAQEGQ